MDSNMVISSTGPPKELLWQRLLRVFWISLRLGCIAFGGPIADIGFFRREFVSRLQWASDAEFQEYIVMSQVLPGPSSSKLSILIGVKRAGVIGGIAAWLGFILPSALLMTALAYLSTRLFFSTLGWVHGVIIVTTAVVAQALIGMVKTTIDSGLRFFIVIGSLIFCFVFAAPFAQLLVIVCACLAGILLDDSSSTMNSERPFTQPLKRSTGIISLLLFFCMFIGLMAVRLLSQNPLVDFVATFYRAGAFVYGSGHVIFPLLQSEFVSGGWVTSHQFMAGYGAAQAMPGPMFSFAAYLGASVPIHVVRWLLALMGMVSLSLPGFFLAIGILPFWSGLRSRPVLTNAIGAVQAALIGVLATTFFRPLLKSAVHGPVDVLVVILFFYLVTVRKLPSWLIVLIGVLFGLIPSLL